MKKRTNTRSPRARRQPAAPPNSSGARARIATRLETIGAVAAVLTHESRNLLGALSTCVQVLRRNPHLTSEDTELLDIIQSGASRLNEIVGQFSLFRSAFPPRISDVNLHELIETKLAALKRDERCSPSLVICHRFHPSPITLRADGERLGQVLWHLFLNAVQAMGERGQLEVATCQIGSEVEITVRDSGPGIPTNVMPRIFEPLFSTKSRGAGLGLAIARRVVEEHAGTITAQSDGGKGARFILRLPAGSKKSCGPL